MLVHEGIDQNLRFLILEVGKQLDETREYLLSRDVDRISRIHSRDDYIDNLKSIVQRKCFGLAADSSSGEPLSVDLLKAIDVIAANLERISDFCENVVKQLGYIENEEILAARQFGEYLEEVKAAASIIEPALFERDVQLALQICRTEHRLDRRYASDLSSILSELRTGTETETRVTTLFISHYFERMGDSLLNIGEAVISATLGERIKIDEFRALEDSLADSDFDGDFTLKAIGETRSGCRIDRVSQSGNPNRSLIFKEGRASKLGEECDSIERWHEIMPGLAPRIYSYQEQGENAAILFEYLSGNTFDELILDGDLNDLDRGLNRLCETLTAIWTSTRKAEPVGAHFMAQVTSRIADVYAHSESRSVFWRRSRSLSTATSTSTTSFSTPIPMASISSICIALA
jgi:phosphate uptake regulator